MTFRAGRAIKDAYAFAFTNPRRLAALTLKPTVFIFCVAEAIRYFASGLPDFAIGLLLAAPYFALYYVTWNVFFMMAEGGREASPFFRVVFSSKSIKVSLRSVILLFILFIPPCLVTWYSAMVADRAFVGIFLGIVLFCVAVYVSMRIVFWVVNTIAEFESPIKRSFAVTGGCFWKMSWVNLVVYIPATLLSMFTTLPAALFDVKQSEVILDYSLRFLDTWITVFQSLMLAAALVSMWKKLDGGDARDSFVFESEPERAAATPAP